MSIAYVGLGSNIGDRIKSIKKALIFFNDHPNINLKQTSSFYETEPLEYPDQNWFINAVAEIETTLQPEALFKYFTSCENELGRTRMIRWGPREIDIDLLLYDNDIISTSKLQIPHLRMHYRPFVLIPLNEIAPEIVHPILNLTAKELLGNLQTSTEVRKLEGNIDERFDAF